MNARRTAVHLTFAGVDISTDINKHLLSLTYTDNEEDKTDDLQLSLDDREGVWLGNWLNTPGASKGVEISAVIVQKNWESNGKDRVLDCGVLKSTPWTGAARPQKRPSRPGPFHTSPPFGRRRKRKHGRTTRFPASQRKLRAKTGLPVCLNPRSTLCIPGKSRYRNRTSPFFNGFARPRESA